MPTLHWIGKEAVVNHHRDVPYRLLHCDKSKSAGDPDSGNLLVQGDNLEALKALLPYYAGKVKCIYIDPPYNTGNESWVYNDNVNSPAIKKWLGQVVGREAEDLTRHDKWLCMMYPRLALLREFLSEDGAIFVSIDDVEASRLQLVLNEIFGNGRFVAQLIWKSRQQRDNRNITGVSIDHEYVFCYGGPLRGSTPTRENYSNPDDDPRGPWSSSNMVGLATKDARPNLHYDLIHPETGVNYGCPEKGWRYEPATMLRLHGEDKIIWPKKATGRPRRKFFLSEIVTETTGFPSIIAEEVFTRNGTADLRDVVPGDAFSFPKPTALIRELVDQTADSTSLILDSFAGSGTTGHAVLQMNKADGGNRRFICIEMDETIARDVTAQRLRKVVQGYTNAKGDAVEPLGGGFRFCTLGRPLFDAFGSIDPEVKFNDLAAHVFFSETGSPMPKGRGARGRGQDDALLGAFEGRAIYLLFNGILGDKKPQGGNVLTLAVLASLPEHPEKDSGPKVVYGEACRISPARLRAAGVTFKQVPWEVRVG